MTSYTEQRQTLLERKQKIEATIAQLREDMLAAIEKANSEVKSISDNLHRLDAEHAAHEKQRIKEIFARLEAEERAMQKRIDAERSRLAAEEMEFQQKIDAERARLAEENLAKQQVIDEEQERQMAEAAAEELERQLQEEAERTKREAEERMQQQILELRCLKEEIEAKESNLFVLEQKRIEAMRKQRAIFKKASIVAAVVLFLAISLIWWRSHASHIALGKEAAASFVRWVEEKNDDKAETTYVELEKKYPFSIKLPNVVSAKNTLTQRTRNKNEIRAQIEELIGKCKKSIEEHDPDQQSLDELEQSLEGLKNLVNEREWGQWVDRVSALKKKYLAGIYRIVLFDKYIAEAESLLQAAEETRQIPPLSFDQALALAKENAGRESEEQALQQLSDEKIRYVQFLEQISAIEEMMADAGKDHLLWDTIVKAITEADNLAHKDQENRKVSDLEAQFAQIQKQYVETKVKYVQKAIWAISASDAAMPPQFDESQIRTTVSVIDRYSAGGEEILKSLSSSKSDIAQTILDQLTDDQNNSTASPKDKISQLATVRASLINREKQFALFQNLVTPLAKKFNSNLQPFEKTTEPIHRQIENMMLSAITETIGNPEEYEATITTYLKTNPAKKSAFEADSFQSVHQTIDTWNQFTTVDYTSVEELLRNDVDSIEDTFAIVPEINTVQEMQRRLELWKRYQFNMRLLTTRFILQLNRTASISPVIATMRAHFSDYLAEHADSILWESWNEELLNYMASVQKDTTMAPVDRLSVLNEIMYWFATSRQFLHPTSQWRSRYVQMSSNAKINWSQDIEIIERDEALQETVQWLVKTCPVQIMRSEWNSTTKSARMREPFIPADFLSQYKWVGWVGETLFVKDEFQEQSGDLFVHLPQFAQLQQVGHLYDGNAQLSFKADAWGLPVYLRRNPL